MKLCANIISKSDVILIEIFKFDTYYIYKAVNLQYMKTWDKLY